MPANSRSIFHGLRILDLTRVMSGPYCTAMFADLGAEVVKIESPGVGDEARLFAPHVQGESTYFALLNRGKKSVTVNLKSAQGLDLVRELARQSDVLVENFRPGVMDRLGLDYARLSQDNPRLIYASISGFGQAGPFRDLPAFDLVIQAMSGLMSITGERDGRALAVGESMADVCTGMFAAFGVASALYDREHSGKGRQLDVAMLDSVFSMLVTSLSRQLFTDRKPGRVGNRHPETYPVDSFEASDGVVVLVGFTDATAVRILNVIGRPDLASDPRFQGNAARNAHETQLRALIGEWTRSRTRAQVLEALRGADVPTAPVWSLDELFASGHLEARDLVRPATHSTLGDIQVVPQPVKFSDVPVAGVPRSPTLGEDTDEVLTELLGLDAIQIAALRAAKAI
ncbi:MAG: CaiB/BaiF CoA-transferase family protein [Ramlibacter sp.]